MEMATSVWKGGIFDRNSSALLRERSPKGITFFPYGLPSDRTTPSPQIRHPMTLSGTRSEGRGLCLPPKMAGAALASGPPRAPRPSARDAPAAATAEHPLRSAGGRARARTHVSARGSPAVAVSRHPIGRLANLSPFTRLRPPIACFLS